MLQATRRQAAPLPRLVAGVALAALSGSALLACQPTPTASPAVVPSGGPATFRPTPTPVPGSSEIPSQPPGTGNRPQPTIQVPPPIP